MVVIWQAMKLGTDFIETISDITGADVAASDDLTGAADKGGDWDLEFAAGTIETQSFSAVAFDGVLMDTDGDGVDDVDDIDDDNDGITDLVEQGALVNVEGSWRRRRDYLHRRWCSGVHDRWQHQWPRFPRIGVRGSDS